MRASGFLVGELSRQEGDGPMQLISNYNDYSIYDSRIAIIQKEKNYKEKQRKKEIGN